MTSHIRSYGEELQRSIFVQIASAIGDLESAIGITHQQPQLPEEGWDLTLSLQRKIRVIRIIWVPASLPSEHQAITTLSTALPVSLSITVSRAESPERTQQINLENFHEYLATLDFNSPYRILINNATLTTAEILKFLQGGEEFSDNYTHYA